VKDQKSKKSYIDDDGEVQELDQAWFDSAAVIIPPKKSPRTSISLRIDPEVLAAFRSLGPGYQSRMHALLAAGAQRIKKSTERMMAVHDEKLRKLAK
jgi:uncharacterized protein (DUF4415 family)